MDGFVVGWFGRSDSGDSEDGHDCGWYWAFDTGAAPEVGPISSGPFGYRGKQEKCVATAKRTDGFLIAPEVDLQASDTAHVSTTPHWTKDQRYTIASTIASHWPSF